MHCDICGTAIITDGTIPMGRDGLLRCGAPECGSDDGSGGGPDTSGLPARGPRGRGTARERTT